MITTEHILKNCFGFVETHDFTWVKDNYICVRWMCGEKLWVYKRIEGGVWKLSYFLPHKIDGNDIQNFKETCDELFKQIQRERKLERILFSE